MRTVVLALALLAACTCPPPAAAPAPPPPGPGPTTEPPPAEKPPLPAQGEKCEPDQGCASGLTCVSYYGIAGPSGPEFHSCEIPCGTEAATCPEGQTCITIADGPGQVCRAPERPEPEPAPGP
jgi:hypothetical protein